MLLIKQNINQTYRNESIGHWSLYEYVWPSTFYHCHRLPLRPLCLSSLIFKQWKLLSSVAECAHRAHMVRPSEPQGFGTACRCEHAMQLLASILRFKPLEHFLGAERQSFLFQILNFLELRTHCQTCPV